MAYFINGYPYSDTHNLNLDWVIDTLKRIATEVGDLHYGLEIHVTDTAGTEIYTFTVKDNGIYITRPDGGTPFFYNFSTQTLHAPYFDGQSFLFATGRTTGQMRAGSLVLDNALPIAQGGTGATSAESAREALGAVNKAGDTMSGRLYARGFTTMATNGYPNLYFNNSNDVTGYIVNEASNRRFLFNEYPSDSSTLYESYALPAPSTGLTATQYYSVLTTKNPVTVAQGGTGDTGTVDGPIAGIHANVTVSEVRLRRWGLVVSASGQITSTTALDALVTLFTLPAGFRSTTNTVVNTRIFNGSTGASLSAYTDKNGAFICRSAIAANTPYYFEFSFIM